ncbi:efflux RND transporter periplasmic adaptor subunit [Porifericola rhodea]|uniref:efflux RND transporter periplasmic adaptor subunit n=1 Tax=Porifericola rhodea TaxID=930972 RepID=UPI00266530AD|nr:efflux RND transporter periplasmic adaptor subunit [Porifericola rhodea]WKN31034.1 efflux RND transporter periplasmic adaptor subunit [Porifericola rhodea]
MGMDRKIEKKKWTKGRIIGLVLGVGLLSFILYSFLFADHRSKLNVEKEKITISTVSRQVFQEYIPETGIVMPSQTIYMDAVEGGVVQDIKLESGALVEKGDTIMRLSNSNLQLDVMNREAQLYEQLNILRTTRLQLDQNDLNQKAELAQIEYQLQLLKPQFDRYKELAEKKLISQRELEEVQEEYQYNLRRRDLTYAAYKSDSISRAMQLYQIRMSEDRMLKSLDAVGNLLNNLTITAPREGLLTTPDWEPGQSIDRGERLGQVAILDSFKIRVAIDELYLPRIEVGQQGTFDFDGKTYRLEIYKKYPTVSEGNFEVDMRFVSEVPSGIRRGQSLRLRLELGSSEEAVLIPTGGFFRDTGGNKIFVLNNDESRAYIREISLGRKNSEHYEVLEGLEPGEKVITSSYENFGENEVLVF